MICKSLQLGQDFYYVPYRAFWNDVENSLQKRVIALISFIRDIIPKKVIVIGSTSLFSLCFLIFV